MNTELIQKTDVDIREFVSMRFLLLSGILVAAFALAYGGVMAGFVRTWLSRDDFSHGFLVPFISLYFVWSARKRLFQSSLNPSLCAGAASVAVAGVLLVIGNLGFVSLLTQISFLLIVPALVLLLAGSRLLMLLALPLAYLILMNPILDDIIGPFRWPMQLLSSFVAAHVLGFIGIPVFRHSCFLELPQRTLEVASVCSGLNYTVAIVAIAFPLASISQKTVLRKLILIIGGILIGIAANLVRVVVVAIWAYTHPQDDIHGPMHIFQGFSVSVVGFIVLFIVAWLLGKKACKKDCTSAPTIQQMPNHVSDTDYRKLNKAFYTAILILMLVGIFIRLHGAEAVPLKVDLKDMPAIIGEWKEVSTPALPLFEIQGADSQVVRKYRNLSGAEINLQAAYFSSQSSQKKLIDYRYAGLQKRTGGLSLQTPNIHIGLADMDDQSMKQTVAYWYIVNKSLSADTTEAKYLMARESLLHGRSNGAVVFIWAAAKDDGSQPALIADLADLANKLYPMLNTYLPSSMIE